MLVSNFFIKNQDASWLLSNLEIGIPLSNIPLIGDILYQGSYSVLIIFDNKVLLTGDNFMPELHLRKSGFTERIQKLKKQVI